MAYTVQHIIDDCEHEMMRLGMEDPDRGRMLRLFVEAENDFAHQTHCLYKEGSVSTTNGTYDYTLTTTSPEVLVKVHSIRYGQSGSEIPIAKVPPGVLDVHPSWYADYYEDIYAFISRDVIRLGFNPTTGYKIKHLYSYEPNTAVTADTVSPSIPAVYRRSLVTYIMWRLLENDPVWYEKGDHFRKIYMNEVKANIVIPKVKS